MKIGILTFHRAHNYGAVLQAYALQTYLQDASHEVEIIDYRPSFIENSYKLFKRIKPKSSRSKLLKIFAFLPSLLLSTPTNYLSRRKRQRYFTKFIASKLKCSSESFTQGSIPTTHYDLIIVGSDQVWNTNITRGFDNLYWGEFTTETPARKITYAASSSFYSFSDEQKNKIANLLKNFDNISVREETLKNYLKDNFNTESTTVLDPTLLVDSSLWQNLAQKASNSPYVLTYFANNKTLNPAKKLAKEKEIKAIGVFDGSSIKNLTSLNVKSFKVEEFVGLFKDADFVVCSSFHGLAFSIIFNKQFYYLGHKNNHNSDRALSLLKNLDIEDRFVEEINEITQEIDYKKVNEKLENLREKSRRFLDENLTKNI